MAEARVSLSVAILAITLLPTAIAHDDPKVAGVQQPYAGPGYRAAWRARTGVPLAETKAGQQFPAQGITLLSWLPLGELAPGASSGNDCWGYASPSGREYAIIGTSDGTAFVEVSNPGDAQLVTHIDGPESLWRDMKTYGSYAYAVSEGGDGIQVFGLQQIDNGQVSLLGTVTSGGSTTATHNVAVDTQSGFLYRCGGSSNGLRIYSLANPAQPQYVGSWNDRYVHDAQAVTTPSGQEVVFAFSGFNGGWSETGVDILDVTNKQNIVLLKRIFYPQAAYSHQGWASPDLRYLYIGDEGDEAGFGKPSTTHVYDIQSLTNPSYLGSFTNGHPAVTHNMYTEGDLVYEANYSSGLRVFDASQGPLQANEVAYFDTLPSSDVTDYVGLWSSYVDLPSGTVLGSDMQSGLFVWWAGDAPLAFTYPDGIPELVDPSGDSVVVHVSESTPGELLPGSPTVHWDLGQGLQSAPMTGLGGGAYLASLPPAPCGSTFSWYVSAQSQSGLVWTDPAGSAAQAHQATAAASLTVAVSDDLEAASGWVAGVAGDDASTGQWTLGDPNGTAAQPGDDHSEPGTNCWFTGQGSPGGSVGESDVDGGTTTLISPAFDLSGLNDPQLSYWRWYDNTKGASPSADTFAVDITGNEGQSWTAVEVVGPTGTESSGGWIQHSFRVADLVSLASPVRLRFRASDLGSGSIVEAAIDDLEVVDLTCPPLSVDVVTMSIAAGGTQNFTLDAGSAHGGEFYLLLGSVTGTEPGTPAGSFTLPLAFDPYTVFTLTDANKPPLSTSFASLDAGGGGAAALTLAPGALPSLVGQEVWHAYALLDPATAQVTLTSNAVSLAFAH